MDLLNRSRYFLWIVILGGWMCAGSDPDRESGRLLAERHCSSCHLTPEPEDLPKHIWLGEVLPLMGAMNGIYEAIPRSHYLTDSAAVPSLSLVFPPEARIDSTDWAALQRYFVRYAPDTLPTPREVPIWELDQFRVHAVADRSAAGVPPFTTMLEFDEKARMLHVGAFTARGGLYYSATPEGSLRVVQEFASPPSYRLSDDRLLLMGSLYPSDVPKGSLVTPHDSLAYGELLTGLQRPLAAAVVDVDLDGKTETVVAEFGNYTGQLRAFDGDGQARVLAATPGAIRLSVVDWNDDGHDDLVVLFAQGDERVDLYLSTAQGPRRINLARFPPSFGSADLKVVDIDADGDNDLVIANGDNFDYQPVAKPYHGVHIYENHGDFDLRETYFYPMDGAYGVEVDDFDADGDYDLAAIAYFVPPARRSIYGFVYLEQVGTREFRGSGFLKSYDQNFICLTKGDADGDGDQDLFLGNFAGYLPDGRPGSSRLPPGSPLFVWLENLQHR